MIRCVIFVVLMILWFFGGGYYLYSATALNPGLVSSTLIPWLCVALLGWETYKGIG